MGEGEITRFLEHDEVEAGQVVADTSVLAGAVHGLKPVDEFDDADKNQPRAPLRMTAADRDGQIRLARAGAADTDGVALVGNEGAGGKFSQ